ncbi:MAG: uncharacterized protein QOK02_6599 [Mycobacterium sp.]|nr:uncharacterized protein [Mycobacterium sp.]
MRVRLPRASAGYRIERDLAIPMRDGANLLADRYVPSTATPRGVLLLRTPYGRRGLFPQITAGLYAERGYHVLLQSVRGTFGSDGAFEPGVNEVADGADTVDWLREQSWFSGRFATVGASYLGYTQWAQLASAPAELVTAAITMGAHDLAFTSWGTGSYALADLFGWSFQIAEQEMGGSVRRLFNAITFLKRLNATMAKLPLTETGGASVADRAPWHRHWLEHPDPRDEYWDPARMTSALDSASIPVLLIGGWQDVFVDQTLEQYQRLRKRGVDVALVVGPWTHAQGGGDAVRESLAWLDEHLGGEPRRGGRVRIFVTGGAGWRDLLEWPPRSADFIMYPGPGSTLVGASPMADGSSSRFTYDPAQPTPTVGGRLLFGKGGYQTDTKLATRSDVVAFTGQPLTEDLEVIGTPRVELAHSTDIPWADVFVRISEVDRRGRSHNVTDGYVRLSLERSPLLRLDMDAIAHRFRAGNRIRLIVAGGSFPRFARNLGTGEPAATGTRLARCTHVVTHAGSRLILPVPAL